MADQQAPDVLVVHDDPDERRLTARILERAGFAATPAGSLQEAVQVLETVRPKVVLFDHDLPDGRGVRITEWVRSQPVPTGTYLIMMSAVEDRDLPSRAIESGVDDFLSKPVNAAELIARVRVGARMWTMHDQLRRAAVTDGLTQLHNHDHFIRLLDAEMKRSRRYGRPLAMIMIDVDHFKAINDAFGHLAGNAALEEIARILKGGVRDVDVVGRFGGEEFAIVLPEATTLDAEPLAERLRKTIAESLRAPSLHAFTVTASFGVADSEDPRVTGTADLVELADRAMYLAKRRGRNQVARASDLTESGEFLVSIEANEVEWLKRRVAALSIRAKDLYVQSVAALLQALEEKDSYTGRHAMNTAYYAQQIAEQLGLSPASVKSVHNAALLHDIGKVGVPDRILMKQTPLTPLEKMVLDQVPLISVRILDHLRILEAEMQIIRHQREYFDGSGLPARLRGTQIPIGSRILLAADAFDAMTTDRVYRSRRPIPDVLAEMRLLAGKQFDPDVVRAMEALLADHLPLWQARIEETIEQLRLPRAADRTVAESSTAS